jgi:hypothetical protein
MPDIDLITAAVFNNAVWCDAVCQALGCDTDFVDDLWINSGTSPPFYPNAISLTRDGSDAQSRRIREMVQAGLPEGWTEKDAFETLNLAELGFRVLFVAEWVALPPDTAVNAAAPPDVAWQPVTTDVALVAWEAAWRSAQTRAPGEVLSRVFMPDLLDDPDIVLLAAQRAGQIAAVVVANRSDDGSGPVAGISNLVLPEDDRAAYRAGAVAAVRAAFPGLPVVGYEKGADLDAMVALGFERLGSLRIWTND